MLLLALEDMADRQACRCCFGWKTKVTRIVRSAKSVEVLKTSGVTNVVS